MLDAAKAMKLSAKDLLELQIIDEIIEEPLGGAHRDKNFMLENLKKSISNNLENFKSMTSDEIFNDRKNKFLRVGRSKGFINNLDELSSLNEKNNEFRLIINNKKKLITIISLLTVLMGLMFIFL